MNDKEKMYLFGYNYAQSKYTKKVHDDYEELEKDVQTCSSSTMESTISVLESAHTASLYDQRFMDLPYSALKREVKNLSRTFKTTCVCDKST